MRFQEFSYEVRVEVELTPAEVDILIERAGMHYDSTCRAAQYTGRERVSWNPREGFLLKWRRQVSDPALPVCAKFWQLDLCCKIMEQPDPNNTDNPEHQALTRALVELVKRLQAESGRCNISGTHPAFTPAEELRPLLQQLDNLIGFREAGGTVNSGPILRAYEALPCRIKAWAREE